MEEKSTEIWYPRHIFKIMLKMCFMILMHTNKQNNTHTHGRAGGRAIYIYWNSPISSAYIYIYIYRQMIWDNFFTTWIQIHKKIRLEKITIRNNKQCFIVFNKTCLNNNLLPKYTLFTTHTHTHTYIYIYIYIYIYMKEVEKSRVFQIRWINFNVKPMLNVPVLITFIKTGIISN